ncbi:MAG: TlpA family protein disulfide reductase, partial [Deltaproteobacteria bacterium]|nr:TlpA family protein disulfide reductase [Deltaproteobacteria bacterium]
MSYNFKTKMFALACLVFFLAFYGCNREVGAGETAPDFSLKDLSGNMVSIKQYRGHIVLMDFWATWCPPCRKSIPELISLQNKYRDQKLV